MYVAPRALRTLQAVPSFRYGYALGNNLYKMTQAIAVSRKHLTSPLNYIKLALLSCLHTFRLFVTLGSENNYLCRPSE